MAEAIRDQGVIAVAALLLGVLVGWLVFSRRR